MPIFGFIFLTIKTFKYNYTLITLKIFKQTKMVKKMDCYERKKMAYFEIDSMTQKGMSDDAILYRIQTHYGFSKNLILNHIELLKRIKAEGNLAFEQEEQTR